MSDYHTLDSKDVTQREVVTAEEDAYDSLCRDYAKKLGILYIALLDSLGEEFDEEEILEIILAMIESKHVLVS